MKFILIFILTFSTLLAHRDGGPYLGFGYGISKYYDGGFNKEIIENQSKTSTFYAGAYINKHLSVELGYIDFNANNLGDGFEIIDKQSNKNNISFSAITISTLAHYAFFSDTLDFYARFGAGEISQSTLFGEGFSMTYGLGIAYRFNKYFSMKFAYDTYQFGFDENSDKSSDYRMGLDYIYSAIEVQF